MRSLWAEAERDRGRDSDQVERLVEPLLAAVLPRDLSLSMARECASVRSQVRLAAARVVARPAPRLGEDIERDLLGVCGSWSTRRDRPYTKRLVLSYSSDRAD
jgi:hypothetical protein